MIGKKIQMMAKRAPVRPSRPAKQTLIGRTGTTRKVMPRGAAMTARRMTVMKGPKPSRRLIA